MVIVELGRDGAAEQRVLVHAIDVQPAWSGAFLPRGGHHRPLIGPFFRHGTSKSPIVGNEVDVERAIPLSLSSALPLMAV